MIDKQRVCPKLSQLRERRDLLRQLAATPRPLFLADRIKRSAAERELQVCIEICLDIGHHLIAGSGLPRPAEYRDVFRILGEAGVISADLASRLETMASFRNRLVHGYAEVDPERVYDFLQHECADFDEFARVLAAAAKQSGSQTDG